MLMVFHDFYGFLDASLIPDGLYNYPQNSFRPAIINIMCDHSM